MPKRWTHITATQNDDAICARCEKPFARDVKQRRVCLDCRTGVCVQCDEPFTIDIHRGGSYDQKFCSHSCASRWNAINNDGIRSRFEEGRAASVTQRAQHLSRLYKGKPNLALRGRRKSEMATAAEERKAQRNSYLYVAWRRAVYDRDNYVCQKCGERGGRLEAHHIQSWLDFPELRYMVSNGATLCQVCHLEGEHGWNLNGVV